MPDPRRYGPGDPGDPLLRLAAARTRHALVGAMRELLARREDAGIRRALALAPGREIYRELWEALCAAAEPAPGAPGEILTRVFALPLVLVSGARGAVALAGALPDVAALVELLERHGALGASRNVGFGNALVSLDTLERLPPSTAWAWSAAGPEPRALAPEPLAVRAGEAVHLRFLLGAAIAPATAPGVVETAAHIGAWGMPLARALKRQLGAPGVELLALPRPPAPLLKAAYAGRRAQLEAALDLFLSNAVRRCRAATGDPALVISVHESGPAGAELRVSVSSVFDDALLEGYRWPLHPLEDPDEIARGVRERAAECRLSDVRVVEAVLPEGGGARPLFVRASEAQAPRH